jgi:hypothetical protein
MLSASAMSYYGTTALCFSAEKVRFIRISSSSTARFWSPSAFAREKILSFSFEANGFPHRSSNYSLAVDNRK